LDQQLIRYGGSFAEFVIERAEGSYRFWPQDEAGIGLAERLVGLPVALVSPSVKLVTLLLVVVVTAALALRSP